MTLTISKCKLSKQQHTITLNYTLGENEKNSLIFTLMICRNFFAHRNAVCKTRDGLAHLISIVDKEYEYMSWFQNAISKSEIACTLSSHILIVGSFCQISPLMRFEIIFQVQRLPFRIEYHSWYIKLKSCDDQSISCSNCISCSYSPNQIFIIFHFNL